MRRKPIERLRPCAPGLRYLFPLLLLFVMPVLPGAHTASLHAEISGSDTELRDALPDIYERWLGRHLPLAIRVLIWGGTTVALTLGTLALWTYTLRRQVEHRSQALRRQQAVLRAIIDSIPDLIFIKDRESVYLGFNKAFSDFCGLSEEQLIGKTDFAFASHEEAEFYRQKDREMLATGHPRRNEEWIEYQDGRRVLLETLKAPYHGPDGRILGVIGVSRDITAQRRSDELARENDILQSVMNGAGDVHLVYLDRDFTFVRVNDNYARTCGYAPEEMVGKNHFDLYPHAENQEIFAHVRDTGQPVEVHDKPFEFPDQPTRGITYWDWTLRPVKDKTGTVQGLVFALRETTGRKMAEDALLESQKEAERVARVKADFLSHMSHEIRTPLNGVLGMAQVGMARSHEETTRDAFRAILESGKVLVGIVDDILDFSKIEAGKLTIESVPTSLRQLMDHAMQLMQEDARARGNALKVYVADDVPEQILTDPLRLNQILLNLLSNAVKFTERGQITAEARQEGARLILSMEDTGMGLTPDQIERLFHPFEQADSSTTRHFGGTGLGLAITRRLVELMGGQITVRSRQGEGSRFEVNLPLFPVARLSIPASIGSHGTATPPARLAGLNILAADDNEVNRMVLEELLQLEGARITLVRNGSLAVSEVRNAPGAFHLVLMDIQMPEMDGYEATRRIRQIEPDMPVVGLTGFAMSGERDRCIAVGMADHVAKPIDIERLVPAILRNVKRPAATGIHPSHPTSSTTTCEASSREAPYANRDAPPEAPAKSNSCIDWKQLESRYNGRRDSLIKILTTVVSSEGGIPRMLKSAVTAGDLELLASLSHSLTGIAGLILAKEMLGGAIQVEMAALAKKEEALRLGGRLAEIVEGALIEIKQYLED